MKYGICLQSVVSVRKQPGDHCEMTNQLLFGDLLLIKDQLKQWLLIETADDGYNGWVDQKQIMEITDAEFKQLNRAMRYYSTEYYHKAISVSEQEFFHVSLGSQLPQFENGKFLIKNTEYHFSGKIKNAENNNNRNTLIEIAKMYLGVPYLWGGRSAFGIDCSGMVQIVYKMCGILLPRDAAEQVNSGETINFIDDAKAGDLAFFDNEENKIIHVGILMGSDQIIHASGEVKTDKIDHFGIYQIDQKKYSHHLRIIKRITDF